MPLLRHTLYILLPNQISGSCFSTKLHHYYRQLWTHLGEFKKGCCRFGWEWIHSNTKNCVMRLLTQRIVLLVHLYRILYHEFTHIGYYWTNPQRGLWNEFVYKHDWKCFLTWIIVEWGHSHKGLCHEFTHTENSGMSSLQEWLWNEFTQTLACTPFCRWGPFSPEPTLWILNNQSAISSQASLTVRQLLASVMRYQLYWVPKPPLWLFPSEKPPICKCLFPQLLTSYAPS